MGMEAVSDAPHEPVETVTDGENSPVHGKENEKMSEVPDVTKPINPSSHMIDEQSKGPGKDVSEANIPTNAMDEWPEPKKIHNFYFVRYRTYDEPQLKVKLDFADKEIQKKNQSRFQVTDALKAKRSERAHVISQLKSLSAEDKQFRMAVDEKRREMEPLQDALGKLRGPNNAGRDRSFGLCSSEEELDDLIRSLNDHIQHESISLKEEKQIIKEINQLQGTREKVIANATMRAKIQESLGQKEEIQDQVKLIGVDLIGVKRGKQAVKAKIMSLEDELKAIDNGIKSLQGELELVTDKRNKAYETLHDLRMQRDAGNSFFYQNRSLLNKAREMAAKRDLSSLEELHHTEMEAFMSQWSSTKAFREDYEKRILQSLDSRELGRDGRIRNPNEKPFLAVQAQSPLETDKPSKVTDKQQPPKQETKSLPKQDSSNKKGHKEAISEERTKNLDNGDKESKNKSSGSEKAENKDGPGEVDLKKVKEMKREEEIAKAKQAFERKKKQAEKAAAKAAVKAQKEAEKKLKEREKKARKKAAASAIADDQDRATEAVAMEAEDLEATDKEADVMVPLKNKVARKETSVRERRRTKGGGLDSRQKLGLKRRKSTNYWVWAAAPASMVAMLLLALGYWYTM